MTRKSLPFDAPGQTGMAWALGRLGVGFWLLLLLLALSSFIVAMKWMPSQRVYVQGEVAEADVMAGYSFDVLDSEATRLRREAARKAQPLICALDTEPVDNMRARVQGWLLEAGRLHERQETAEYLRQEISDIVGEELGARFFSLLAVPEFQDLMNNIMLPWAELRLRSGVAPDARKLAAYDSVIMRDISDGRETLVQDSESVPDIKDFLLDLEREVRIQTAPPQAKRLLVIILGGLAEATLSPNEEETRQRAEEAAQAVLPVVRNVARGEVIVRQGERIDAGHLSKLNALRQRVGNRFNAGAFLGLCAFAALISLGVIFSPGKRAMRQIKNKDMILIGCMNLFLVLLAEAFHLIGLGLSGSGLRFPAGAEAFAVPVAGVVGLSCLILSSKRYYTMAMLFSFFCAVIAQAGIELFLFYYISSMFCAWLIVESRNRKEVFLALLPLSGGLLLLWFGVACLRGPEAGRFLSEGAALLLGAGLSIMIIFALNPLLGFVFGFTTRFMLMEMSDQEHPLLRRFMLEAPGSYHHSIIVAGMAESAARAIGAHGLLTKVGALYHDVGKMDKAEYFIENQFQHANPHNRLTPTMSALVLISHVKRGGELGRQYKLGKEVCDIIEQHHGNSLIRYFYHKARLLNSEAREADFSYAGPRPQSREAALVLLADVVEASSRTLADPTPSRIKVHVQRIIRNVLAEGQLDSTDLTFKDLDKVVENFVMILTGIFHKRIEYPGKVPSKPGQAEEEAAPSPAPVPADPAAPAAPAIPADPYKDYSAARWLEADEGKAPRRRAAQVKKTGNAAQSRPAKSTSRPKRRPAGKK